jgi:hypothetical protein
MSEETLQEIAQMQSVLCTLQQKAAEIAAQLTLAKAKAKSEKVFADPEWFTQATLALKKTRADIALQQQAIKLCRKRSAYLYNQNVEYHFMQVAKTMIDPETFSDWLAAAKEAMQESCNSAAVVL